MKRTSQVHLSGITKDSFTNWINHEAFIMYASSSGKNGKVELGVNGKGTYALKIWHKTGIDTSFYKDPDKAIKAYGKQLI